MRDFCPSPTWRLRDWLILFICRPMRVNTLWTDSDETSGSEACGTRNGSFAIIVWTVSELSVGHGFVGCIAFDCNAVQLWVRVCK